MNDNALALLLERITNLGNHVFSVENNLIDYMEKNPKGDNQWFEARLRALEDKFKNLENAPLSNDVCVMQDLAPVVEQVQDLNKDTVHLYGRLDELEKCNKENRVMITDLLREISRLAQRQDPKQYNDIDIRVKNLESLVIDDTVGKALELASQVQTIKDLEEQLK